MNCARNERLLALHAGGDLPDEQARALSAHLRACDACRRAASDFAAGRELLGAHEPPEFDAAFFDRIRQNVLRELDDDAPTPPAFARLTALLFGRRAMALAACVAFLVAAGAIISYLRDGRGPSANAPRQLANAGGETRQGHAAAPAVNSPGMSDVETESGRAATVAAAPAPRRQQSVASVRRVTRARRDARIAEPSTPALAAAAAAGAAQAAGDAAPFEVAAPASEVAVLEAPAQRKMLRIELQTGDPDVRIIWLSPQEPEKLPR